MKRTLLFIFGLVSIYTFSQTKRFYYNLLFKLDSTNISRDVVVLEVNENENLFFSDEYLRVDSLNNVRNNFIFAYPKFKKILRWHKIDNSFDFINNISMNFYEYNTTKNINWNLTSDKKKIGIYNVQKATCKYGGRNWTAWFTNEIPLNYGPYVFYGLPGLVLEVFDENHDYHFSFAESKNLDSYNPSDKTLAKYLGNIKFTIKENNWKTVQENFYNNPIPEYKSGEAMMLKNDKTPYSAQDYRNLEISIQESIKKLNNPIELSEKVNYK